MSNPAGSCGGGRGSQGVGSQGGGGLGGGEAEDPGGPGGLGGPVYGLVVPHFVRGPGWGPEFDGHLPPGPFGGPWCCWPFLCVLFFVIAASTGITLIQTIENCSEDIQTPTQTTCTKYDAAYALGVGIIILIICYCCFCTNPSGEIKYDHQEGTAVERAHIMATEAPPPPAITHVNDLNKPPSAPIDTGTDYTRKV